MQSEGDPSLDPLYEAVGRAVIAAAGVETWLYVTASSLGVKSYDDADRAGPEKVAALLRTWGTDLPEPHRTTFLSTVDRAARVMSQRNGLVHGLWASNEDHTLIQSQRPPRPPRGERANSLGPDLENRPRWKVTTFSRASLLEMARECHSLFGEFQVGLMRWGQVRDESVRGAAEE